MDMSRDKSRTGGATEKSLEHGQKKAFQSTFSMKRTRPNLARIFYIYQITSFRFSEKQMLNDSYHYLCCNVGTYRVTLLCCVIPHTADTFPSLICNVKQKYSKYLLAFLYFKLNVEDHPNQSGIVLSRTSRLEGEEKMYSFVSVFL